MAKNNNNLIHRIVAAFKPVPQETENQNITEANNKNNSRKAYVTTSKNTKFLSALIGAIKLQIDQRANIISANTEFNLDDIYNASLSDSYVKMALSKYQSLVYKAGYQLKSENDAAVEYLNKRFKIFSLVTGKPMDILFQEISDDLVMYSNAFIVKKRSDSIEFPGLKANGIFDQRAVAGYFRIDPRDMYMQLNEHGSIKRYILRKNGAEQYFAPTDVIHIYMDRDADNKFGTPRYIAALEDVKLLRRIEGNVMALIYRFTMPIYHWKVGLEDQGRGATDNEVDELTAKIAGMDIDGCIVTNERTNVNTIGAEGTALDATGYLSYFEKRVFSALGVSESQMGRGGAKQDADSMESQMHDEIKHIQRHLKIFIENYMLIELLLEGGFDPISNPDDYVSYEFNEISLDTKIKLENHELAKFQGNIITFEEVRHELGKRTDDADLDGLYNSMITNDSAIKQINAKAAGEIKVAKATAQLNNNTESNTASIATGIKGNGTQKSANTGANGTIKSINTPSNQYGTTSVKVKESESLDEEESESPLDKIINDYSNISDLYQNIKEDAVINKSDFPFTLTVAFGKLSNDLKSELYKKYKSGQEKLISDYNKKYKKDIDFSSLNNHTINSLLADLADTNIKNIKNDILEGLNSTDISESENIESIFDKNRNRIFYAISYLGDKAYWNGYADSANELGIKNVNVRFNKDSIDSRSHPSKINSSEYNLDDIPSYHAFCKCKLSIL